MKLSRIAIAIVGLVAMVMGIRQMMRGMSEMGLTKQELRVGARFTDTKHGCSYDTIEGWTKKDGPGGAAQFTSASGANFSVVSEPFDGSTQQYADMLVEALKKQFPKVAVISLAPFTTDQGILCTKASLSNEATNKDQLFQAFYVFEGKQNQKILLTSTDAFVLRGRSEPVFDGLAKRVALLP